MIRTDTAVSIKEESYNELPRWVLGVQMTILGSVTVLRTSPVQVCGVNGTHLYGKYRSTLLVTIDQDGNSNIILVAFTLVEGENAEPCSFFLSHIWQHVTPQPGILIISDRHNGIKGKDARRFLVNVAHAKIEVEFDNWYDILRSEDPALSEVRAYDYEPLRVVNSILKGVRNLSICSLVKSTYVRKLDLLCEKP
ncbi:hypothetical protein Ahy_A07g036450 [Arachis hypogaea]|uniref:MULE transposase domain-containing protein n=1 Tax=Arachis hypogaea TaxID=3818 RepID=A0A445CG76_ARAHY|nr:hypothetical protein Ahy_A07g036450 [Arachis hypogaea]